MELEPKPFQTEALRVLREFLGEARITGNLHRAFDTWRKREGDEPAGGLFAGYKQLTGLPDVPYICLRLPTGGGKTVLGAYAVGVMTESWLERTYPLVLWLVPSDAIRAQTAGALRDPDHPYRRALGAPFGGQARVLDIQNFTELKPQDLRANACVVVATMAALRVEKTEGRKVYAHNENLEGHFATPEARNAPGLEQVEAGRPGHPGPKYSFANVLKLHGPLVVVDEAHQFMTELSDKVLERIGAAAVLDLTATPDERSNVLYRASAVQLKEAEMIKLPVVLEESINGWQDALCKAVKAREGLQEAAAGEREYIRPILLVQAQNAKGEANVEAVKRYLLESGLVRPEELAVHTGDTRELDKVDLRSRACGITTIVTVKALVEGWDCPFAYVLCSAANLRSPKDVEQLLGRVLRMPYAAERKTAMLNQAYAFVTGEHFGEAAGMLQDSLVGLGFERDEAEGAVQLRPSLPLQQREEERPELRVEVEAALEFALTPPDESGVVAVEQVEGGYVVRAQSYVPLAVADRIAAAAPETKREAVRAQVDRHNARFAPVERGERFPVPVLVTEINGVRELWSEDALASWLDWRLLDYPADMSRLALDAQSQRYTLDLHGERFELKILGGREAQLGLVGGESDKLKLVGWLDGSLRDNRIGKTERVPWLLQAIDGVLARPGFSLPELDRSRWILLRLLREEMERARFTATSRGYDQLLFGRGTDVVTEVDDEQLWAFPKDYTPLSRCTGYRFLKHYYPGGPGEMKSSGEEFDCAQALDRMDEVLFWVRNLEGAPRQESSFWLQTRTDKFYPDFVARLRDGRTFVAEYKGENLWSNDDSKEKRELGSLWAMRSGGKAVFAMVSKQKHMRSVEQQLRAALG